MRALADFGAEFVAGNAEVVAQAFDLAPDALHLCLKAGDAGCERAVVFLLFFDSADPLVQLSVREGNGPNGEAHLKQKADEGDYRAYGDGDGGVHLTCSRRSDQPR